MRDVIGISKDLKAIEVKYDWNNEQGVIAVYVKCSRNSISKTLEYDADVFLDVDKNDKLVGIEMVNPSTIHIKKCLRTLARKYRHKALEEFSASSSRQLETLGAPK